VGQPPLEEVVPELRILQLACEERVRGHARRVGSGSGPESPPCVTSVPRTLDDVLRDSLGPSDLASEWRRRCPLRLDRSPPDRSSLSFGALLALALVATGGPAPHHHGHAAPSDGFQAMTADAVARMHSAMDVPFSGDADRDFARMMIPHHQGAIDMALVELRYGQDKRLKRLAQEIIVEQQQEIAVMHLALGDALPPGTAAPKQVQAAPDAHQEQ
jgi:Domain of unknown function (DUF305)